MTTILTTKLRRFWFVMSVIWALLWAMLLFYAWLTNLDPYQRWYGFVGMWASFSLVPIAVGWGLIAGVPATLRWIKAGK